MTGDTYERELCNLFRGAGWHAQRAGSSGGGTTADLPDVTIAKNGKGFAIEAKTVAKDETYIYVNEDEVRALQRYADAYGQIPLIAGRWKRTREWHFWVPERMERTDSGTYRGAQDNHTRRVAVVEEGDVPTPEWLTESVMSALMASDIDSKSNAQSVATHRSRE